MPATRCWTGTDSSLSCGWPADSPAVQRGIRYLVGTEMPEGGWEDDQATFTILAGGLYYPYPFMARVMPVDALTDYLGTLRGDLTTSQLGSLPVEQQVARGAD